MAEIVTLSDAGEASQRRLCAVADWTRDLAVRAGEIMEWGFAFAAAASEGRRILLVGNGGSCALADHFAAELVGNFHSDRPPLDVVNLHAAPSTLTAITNDLDFVSVATRGVRAHGRAGDILVCISASGRSENIIAAATTARDLEMRIFALIGGAVEPLASIADQIFTVKADDVATIQELQLMTLHVICDGIDAMWMAGPQLPEVG